jgi:hypothetical protein
MNPEEVITPQPANFENSSVVESSQALPSTEVDKLIMKACVDAFFDYIYPIPAFSFIHRVSFMQNFDEKDYSHPLVQAACGAGSLFLGENGYHRQLGKAWIEEAEIFALKNVDDFTLTNIQILLILTFYFAASRQFRKVMTLLSIATRMAYISRLNYECENLPFVVRESRRRVMWALYIQDRFYSGGLPDFTLCGTGTIHLNLPCTETNFALEIAVSTQMLVSDVSETSNMDIGSLAHCIRILDIRDRILRYLSCHIPSLCD